MANEDITNMSREELIITVHKLNLKYSHLENIEERDKKLMKGIKAMMKILGRERYLNLGKELGYIKVDWEHRKGSYKIKEVKE